jgi:hypothetical protein
MPGKRFEVKVHPKGEGWVVQSEGRTERKFDSKMPAVQYAVQRATRVHERGSRSQVVIYKRSGEVHQEHSYGTDPYASAG